MTTNELIHELIGSVDSLKVAMELPINLIRVSLAANVFTLITLIVGFWLVFKILKDAMFIDR